MSIKPDAWIREKSLFPTHATVHNGMIKEMYKLDLSINESVLKMFNPAMNEKILPVTESQVKEHGWKPMISPFVNELIRNEGDKKVISYGLSSYGYDVRLGNKFKIFTNVHNSMIDPLVPDEKCFVEHEGDFCIIPPNSYILGHTVETFCIPNNVLAIALGKSTYARCAAIVNVTPIEPGFEGQVVIEIANASTLPLKIHAGMGIAQFIFFESNPCEITYRDRGGKYQGQTGVVTSRL